MSKNSLARFVAIALLVLAVIIMVGGALSALIFGSRGFGAGWSEGSNIWFTLPVMALSCSTGFGLLLLGAVLLLLVDISRNLSETKVVIQKPVAVEAVPAGVVAIESPAALAAAAGVAAGVAATEAVEPVAAAPVVAAEAAVPVGETAETWSPRMAEADDVVVVTTVDDETATVEVGDVGIVGVPVVTADASARMAQIEIAEEEPPVEVAPAAAKKPRKSTAKKAAAAATVAAVAADASAEKETDTTELEASVAALKAAADTVGEPPAETAAAMRLPGAQDAARVSAELSAMKAIEEKAPAKRKRKPAKMGLPVAYIAAVSEADAEKLNEVGIRTTEDLLLRGATRQGRQEIASQTGIDASTILFWVNHVDLYRVRGVGEEFAQLLEAAGVDTVVELARRNPTNLQAKLAEINEAQELVRQVPVETQVERWVEEAKTLPRVIKY